MGKPHFVIASSGNAGYACAVLCMERGVECTVVLPVPDSGSGSESGPDDEIGEGGRKDEKFISMLKNTGANVIREGKSYADCARVVERLVEGDPNK